MDSLARYDYCWPRAELGRSPHWQPIGGGNAIVRDMPEDAGELAADSRWPALFPSPIGFVTTAYNGRTALEKVVGVSIVNRFPYVIALSLCREPLSHRHHARCAFIKTLEQSGCAAVQFLPPGPVTDSALQAIASVPEDRTHERIASARLPIRKALTHDAPVFDDAYLVYEARFVRPARDFAGQGIYASPWLEAGSHRVCFLEITAIQLRRDIADGRSQIRWQSLPVWRPNGPLQEPVDPPPASGNGHGRYAKSYTPDYRFPSAGTVAFEADDYRDGMAIRYLAPLPEDQVEVDNDRARWPCFFPSSLGMITTWQAEGRANVMPCGSTTVVSRHPLMIAPCVSYAAINERYAPRATLNAIRRTGRFGCGVPFHHDTIVEAIAHTGNHSIADDPHKVARAGLAVQADDWAPVLPALPIHFDCEVTGEVRLGTHAMFLGRVRRIRIRGDVTPDQPVHWCPWAEVVRAGD